MDFLGKRAVCEITRKNMVQSDSPQMTVKHTARLIKERIHTLSEYVSIFAVPPQEWLRERPLMFCHTYIACLVLV
jgi:hypothetical protein